MFSKILEQQVALLPDVTTEFVEHLGREDLPKAAKSADTILKIVEHVKAEILSAKWSELVNSW